MVTRKSPGRRAALLALLLGLVSALVSGAAAPARAAGTPPPGGMNQCLVLAICLEISTPGSSGAPGGGGGGTGGSTGGGEATCTWKTLTEPCWDADYGWFDQTTGCYDRLADPSEAQATTPPPGASGSMYDTLCFDGSGGLGPGQPFWDNKVPGFGGPPPTPATVGQMAFNQLPFELPVAHVDPNGKSLVGVPTFLSFDTRTGTYESEMGALSATVTLNDVSVTATAKVTSVVWDLGFKKADGTEATQDCTGSGVPPRLGIGIPYSAGMERNPPAGACLADYAKLLSPVNGLPPTTGPSPSGSAAPGGGFWPRVILTWHVTTTGDVWGPIDLQITSAPVQLQIDSLNVLN